MGDGGMLMHNMDDHARALDDSSEMIEVFLTTTLKDIAASANAAQIKQLDGVARGLCEEVARMEKLCEVARGLGKRGRDEPAARQAAIDGVIAQLSDPRFGEEEAKGAFLQNESYKDFVHANRDKAEGIGEGLDDDDDDVMVGEQSLRTQDPFSLCALQKEGDKYPVKMPCRHVYNVSTILHKDPRGNWSLKNCAIPGCNKDLPERRDNLKECPETRHMIKQKARNVGGSASQRHNTHVEDLDD